MKRLYTLLIGMLIWQGSVVAEVKPLAELVSYPLQSAPATVLAKHDSPLAVEVSGVVQQLLVEVGDRVAAGQLLLALDPFPFQQRLNQQQALVAGLAARIGLAEFQLLQAQRLAKENNVSEELLRSRQAELDVLKADYDNQLAEQELARYQLQKSQLRAPFDGVVVERHAQLGGYLSPGVTAIQLLADREQQLRADLSATAARTIDPAGEFEFLLGEQRYSVQLIGVLPQLHSQQRSQQVRFRFVDRVPLVGSSGRLAWYDTRPHLDASYLQRHNGRLGIYLLKQGSPEFVELQEAQEGRAVAVGHLSLQQSMVLDDMTQAEQ